MNYEFDISVAAARTLSVWFKVYELVSLFLTVLFKCTTLYCKVLLQNYRVVQSTTP